MAKRKNRRVKRLLGVKIPKPMGRFIATPVGMATVAGAVVAGGYAASRVPRVRQAASVAGYELRRAGESAGHALSSAARAALSPVIGAVQPNREHTTSKKKGKATRTRRLAQSEAELASPS